MSQWLKHTHKLTWSDAHISYETLKVKLDDDIILMISPFHQTCKRCLKMSEMERTIPKRPSAINKGLRTIDSLNASSDSQSVKMFAFSEYCRVLSIWISNFVQHRLHVCLVIISWRMWRQVAQKAAARVGVRGVLQNNCSIARICSNTNITSEQFFVRVPRMVPRQDAGNTLHITATRSSLTPGKLPSWGSGNPRVSAPLG